jgi:glycosyltransferase involved in cell wall biosynthesis
MKPETSNPLVTVGMPVFNADKTIRQALDSLVNQTYKNMQIVISDNCSTDSTVNICKEYLKKDHRIVLHQQTENIGAAKNFKFVLNHAAGDFFMWAAGDDTRTLDFIEVNLMFLLKDPTYVASTSPNIHEDQEEIVENIVRYALEGSRVKRFKAFFQLPGASNGIFYSLIRTEVIKSCPYVENETFWGWDWIVILYLLTHGPIHRADKGLTVFGAQGVSRTRHIYKMMGITGLRRLVPFMQFNRIVTKLVANWNMSEKFFVLLLLISLNIKTFLKSNKYSALLFFYLKKVVLLPRILLKITR